MPFYSLQIFIVRYNFRFSYFVGAKAHSSHHKSWDAVHANEIS
jgi:hypothetical protein